MLIRVAETNEVRLQPERGTVLLRVAVDGPEKAEVTAQATSIVADLTKRAQRLLAPGHGPITSFTQGQVQNTAERPWNHEGKLLPWVYRTFATMTARFNDFAALFRFIEEVATLPGVEVQGVRWELTKRTEESAQADAQAEVVRRVTEKALRLALAAGAAEIVPTVIADPGLLGDTRGSIVPAPMPMARMKMSAEMASPGGSGLEFQPEEIVITAAIEAEFEAS